VPAETLPYVPAQVSRFPELRYMGSKRRLLPWIHQVLHELDFETALDPFSGSQSVSYLMKAMGRQVVSSDFLNFSATIGKAIIENSAMNIDLKAISILMQNSQDTQNFIQRTFSGVFFSVDDLRFLDRICANLPRLEEKYQHAVAMSALLRSCVKRQPRGVFTISGDLAKYDDGRRDLKLSLEEHFLEQIEAFNQAIFSNGQRNRALRDDVFSVDQREIDLVYLDPPYVPRSDDNCYIKRYHFLEGLSCYWRGMTIHHSTKVKKIPKKYTPFSYRRTALYAFEQMFERFRKQKIVLSYSSNGYPDLNELISLLERTKRSIYVFKRDHRYHFGTHGTAKRTQVEEYLIVGLP